MYRKTLISFLLIIFLSFSITFASNSFLYIDNIKIDLNYAMNYQENFNELLANFIRTDGDLSKLGIYINGEQKDIYGNYDYKDLFLNDYELNKSYTQINFLNLQNGNYVYKYNKDLYYNNSNDNGYLYKNEELLYNHEVWNLFVYKDILYFNDLTEEKLKSMDLDTKEINIIFDGNTDLIYAYDNVLYFKDVDFETWEYKIDGKTLKHRIGSVNYYMAYQDDYINLNVTNKSVYYIKDRKIYEYEKSVESCAYINGKLYFIIDNYLYKDNIILLEDVINYAICGNKIYYINTNSELFLYDNYLKEINILSDEECIHLILCGSELYYTYFDENYQINIGRIELW